MPTSTGAPTSAGLEAPTTAAIAETTTSGRGHYFGLAIICNRQRVSGGRSGRFGAQGANSEPRGYLSRHVEIGGRELRWVTTHLIAVDEMSGGASVRLEQSRRTRSIRALEPAAVLSASDPGRGRAPGLSGAPAHGLGAASAGRTDRGRASDDQRDPASARLLTGAAAGTPRYEWPCPGDLLHIDVKRYPGFAREGHAVTGDRSKTAVEKRNPLGHDYFHAVVDDHSRLAYGELLDDERAATTTAFIARALTWFSGHGIQTRRVMTDGAWSYTRNGSLRELLAQREIRQIVTPPYTPRWNGKVERFHQMMEREWAKGVRYRNHGARNAALPHWLEHYNQRRPHLGIGGRSPISRAHNLSGQNS